MTILLLVLHVIMYSFLGILFFRLRTRFSLIPFYLYLGSLEILVSLLNGIYSLDLGLGIFVGGGTIVYAFIIWSILLLYLVERDQELVVFVIYCLIILQLFYALIYPLIFYLLEHDLVENTFSISPDLFRTSWWIFIVGNFLQLLEAIGLVYLMKKSTYFKNKFSWQLKGIVVYNLILILDGIFFPILIYPTTHALSLEIIFEGILQKIILGFFFSISLLTALFILHPTFEDKATKDVSLLNLIALPRAKVIQRYRKSEDAQNMLRLLLNLLSHDIRNYQTVTSGRADVVLDTSENLSDDVKAQLHAIIKIQHEANALVSTILDLNKVQTTKLDSTPLNLDEIITSTLNDVKSVYPDINFQVENISVLKNVEICAHPLIENVFTNIFTNAVKYRKIDQDTVVLAFSLETQNEMVVLDIADQGIGISDERKKAIFTYADKIQHKRELGLYLVSEILKAFGGKIEANNLSDSPDDHSKGTVLRIFLLRAK
ncbi:MAG: sensor histidine kinase [Candidatus Kariarchaeaceae archaeon]